MKTNFAIWNLGGRSSLLVIAVAGCGLMVSGQAHAQDAADGGEIIVTAQKRAQSINDVPITMVAASGDDLATRRIDKTADLERIVPGLTFTQTPSGPPVYTLRGVGFYDSTLAAAPAVSVYVDEAPLAYPIFSQVGVIDVERVEVLKGPQGTLYGENSTGGAINYIAAKPTSTYSAGGSLSYGRFSTLQGEAYVSGPLSDTLKARVAIKSTQSGAWQTNYLRNDRIGDTHQTAARLLLAWEPSSSARFTLNVNGWIDKSDTQAFQYQETECTVPSNCPAELIGYPVAPDNARAADWTPTNPMSNDDRFFQTTLRSEVDLSPEVTLIALTGYQNMRQRKWIDQDGTTVDNLSFGQTGRVRSFNQELRVTGNHDRLDWIVGGYFSTAKVDDDFLILTPRLSTNLPIPGLPVFTTAGGDFLHKVNSYAVFANAEWQLVDGLTLSGGIRYTKSVRKFSGCETSGPDPQLGIALSIIGSALGGYTQRPVPADGCISLDADTFLQGRSTGRLSEDNVSFRVGLSYELPSDGLIYANVSKGYKSGSFPTVSASSSAQFVPVTQESVLAYEVGTKWPIARGLQLNAAGFYYDYRDKQIRGRIADPIFGALEALVNVPKSRLYGFEAEAVVQPLDGLRISGSVTYTNSKVQRFVGITPTGGTRDFAGSSFPYAPRWQAVADAQYDFDVADGKKAFIGSSLVHHGSTYSSLGEDANFRLNPYVTVDARAGFGAADDSWKVSLYGKNIFNEYYWNNVFQFIDTRFRIAARPVEYGVTLSVKY